MHALTAPLSVTAADRLGLTVFLAVVAHAIVIFGITFVHQEHPSERIDTLDIVLVQHRSEEAPEDADYLAQASQDGGGDQAERERLTTPLPAPFSAPEPRSASAAPPLPAAEKLHLAQPAPSPPSAPDPEPRPAQQVAAAPPPSAAPRPVVARKTAAAEAPVRQVPARKPQPKAPPRLAESTLEKAPAATREQRAVEAPKAPAAKARSTPAPAPTAPSKPARTLSATALLQRSVEMASLDAEIDAKLRAYAKRPRRKWITARTKEHKYAAYMDAWRAKVERIGNLNYPDEARRRRLSGNLLLDVALNANGSINEIKLRRSSGKRVLDDAAIRIVRLSAPFAKFPRKIAAETDILHIQRTWRFLSNNRFSSR